MNGLLEKTYSNALFELANEENSLETTFEELDVISKIFTDNPELIKGLSVPTINVLDKKNIISIIFKENVSELIFNFINVLVEKGRISYIEKIANEFKISYNEKFGILEITATTTSKMSEVLKNNLINKLESISSKKILLIEKVDESILGGIVLSYGNTQVDASIKSKIDNMRAQINSIIA